LARVVLTVPEPHRSRPAQQLRDHGHEVLVLAFALTRARECDPSVERALEQIEQFERVVFVSPAAIEAFVPRVQPCWPARAALAVVGPGSLEALAAYGLAEHAGLALPPGPRFDAAAMLELDCLREVAGQRILIVRGEAGRDEIEQTLMRRGARVDVLVAYETVTLDPGSAARDRLAGWLGQCARSEPVVLVTSGEAIRRLGEWVGRPDEREAMQALRALTIHPRLALALAEAGWRRVETIKPGLAALIDALESGEGDPGRACRSGSVAPHATTGIERD
jgi:uroporphyrinogen-III synthase